ncbi:hypothetical protein KP509_27G003400 [Ceratopteris richardii]|uniref:Uncharacterized protein n=1 Tax=Ceratopteris richardii TaxID=49495 RepID=A0A8T2RDF8_CERRI|nr:hypothetical protein KP509_27G003400 [Ceratopteris richardii]
MVNVEYSKFSNTQWNLSMCQHKILGADLFHANKGPHIHPSSASESRLDVFYVREPSSTALLSPEFSLYTCDSAFDDLFPFLCATAPESGLLSLTGFPLGPFRCRANDIYNGETVEALMVIYLLETRRLRGSVSVCMYLIPAIYSSPESPPPLVRFPFSAP